MPDVAKLGCVVRTRRPALANGKLSVSAVFRSDSVTEVLRVVSEEKDEMYLTCLNAERSSYWAEKLVETVSSTVDLGAWPFYNKLSALFQSTKKNEQQGAHKKALQVSLRNNKMLWHATLMLLAEPFRYRGDYATSPRLCTKEWCHWAGEYHHS